MDLEQLIALELEAEASKVSRPSVTSDGGARAKEDPGVVGVVKRKVGRPRKLQPNAPTTNTELGGEQPSMAGFGKAPNVPGVSTKATVAQEKQDAMSKSPDDPRGSKDDYAQAKEQVSKSAPDTEVLRRIEAMFAESLQAPWAIKSSSFSEARKKDYAELVAKMQRVESFMDEFTQRKSIKALVRKEVEALTLAIAEGKKEAVPPSAPAEPVAIPKVDLF